MSNPNTMSNLNSTHVLALTSNPKARDIVVNSFGDQFAHLVKAAEDEAAKLTRQAICDAFDVQLDESREPEECSGRISLDFPIGWDEDAATAFASQFLDMNLASYGGAAGQYFQHTGIGAVADGHLVISIVWGMDI